MANGLFQSPLRSLVVFLWVLDQRWPPSATENVIGFMSLGSLRPPPSHVIAHTSSTTQLPGCDSRLRAAARLRIDGVVIGHGSIVGAHGSIHLGTAGGTGPVPR